MKANRLKGSHFFCFEKKKTKFKSGLVSDNKLSSGSKSWFMSQSYQKWFNALEQSRSSKQPSFRDSNGLFAFLSCLLLFSFVMHLVLPFCLLPLFCSQFLPFRSVVNAVSNWQSFFLVPTFRKPPAASYSSTDLSQVFELCFYPWMAGIRGETFFPDCNKPGFFNWQQWESLGKCSVHLVFLGPSNCSLRHHVMFGKDASSWKKKFLQTYWFAKLTGFVLSLVPSCYPSGDKDWSKYVHSLHLLVIFTHSSLMSIRLFRERMMIHAEGLCGRISRFPVWELELKSRLICSNTQTCCTAGNPSKILRVTLTIILWRQMSINVPILTWKCGK